MKINTKYHGEIELNKKEVIHFDQGIPGFPEDKEYIILQLTDDGVFYILQSVNTDQLAFIISNPFSHFKEYEFLIPNDDQEHLKIDNPEDVTVFSIITLVEPLANTTANLQAPLVINLKTNKGKQIILNDSIYSTKHKIYTKEASDRREG
ncbi:flagellar assembly protein FliW [Fredinandcohnia quinoae]|uniref:Flagellar assembly factor FliW n=1 Tax=Fredinandcohnia quinoae TaxID=2918902 RepID=A0AAW5E1B2_9BACI|nr:flagellar assembly protein FliW [Fredinandcohnia sp. SECRCQ15]MCH1625070.1 flagellar assembly protein FliW [Fredinandcohnia sp. SECRCQ15]